MTDTDMLYVAGLEKRNESLQVENAELKTLLKAAVEDFRKISANAEYNDERGLGCVLTDEHGCGEGVCPLDSGNECTWRHEGKVLMLIGG